MEPRYRAGDLVYVDPRRAPSIGDDVIVQLVGEVNPGADPAEIKHVLVKQLMRNTAAYYELRSEERRVGKSVSVRVDLGGRRIIKNKKKVMYVSTVKHNE